jgi:hypothetical protein
MPSDEDTALKLLNMSKTQLKKMVVEEMILQVRQLKGFDLQNLYIRLCGESEILKIRNNHEMLRRRIIYKLQEIKFGGLSVKSQTQIKKLTEQLKAGSELSNVHELTIKNGTKLLREYQGQKHEVIVLEKGFKYRNKEFRSLSGIAKEITGTKWNGKLFFGVKK